MTIRSRAFSLVEVVVALGILAFAGLPLVGLFSVALNVNQESAEELKAILIQGSWQRGSTLSKSKAARTQRFRVTTCCTQAQPF